MAKHDLARKLKKLNADLAGLKPSEELSVLDQHLLEDGEPEFALHIQITRAKVLADIGKESEAISLLDACSRSPLADESAAYFAAEILVQSDQYREAVGYLELAEKQIQRNGSTYYRTCIYLLHAYCAAKLGEFELAGQMLEMISDRDGDEEMIWLSTRPVISISAVEALIAPASARQGKL